MLKKLGQELWQRVVLSYKSTLIGIACAAAIVCIDTFTTALQGLPEGSGKVAAGLAVALGALLKAKMQERILPPAPPAMKTLLMFAVGSMLLAAAPARASGPGVVCLSGCEAAHPKLGALADVQLSSVVWAGPGIGILPFVYSGETKSWSQIAAPAFSYGVWWRPAGWTATKSLLGANLSLTADFSSLSHVDPIITVVLLDYVTIGGGVRARFATGDQKGGLSPLFALGFTTSFGGP